MVRGSLRHQSGFRESQLRVSLSLDECVEVSAGGFTDNESRQMLGQVEGDWKREKLRSCRKWPCSLPQAPGLEHDPAPPSGGPHPEGPHETPEPSSET